MIVISQANWVFKKEGKAEIPAIQMPGSSLDCLLAKGSKGRSVGHCDLALMDSSSIPHPCQSWQRIQIARIDKGVVASSLLLKDQKSLKR